MNILIKSAKIVDPNSKYHLKTMDVLVENGLVKKIAKSISEKVEKVIEEKGLHLSLGWIDLLANFQEPGYEQMEDFQSGIKAASAGGFTKVILSPATNPVRDSKSEFDYLKSASKNAVIDIYGYASLSANLEGKELSEINETKIAGAIGIFDDRKSVENPNLLKNALLYAKGVDQLVVNFPFTKSLSVHGVMNEGINSTALGLKGIPAMAENIMVERDLAINDYANGRLHFSTLSTAESVKMVSAAKSKGKNVSCDLASYQILLDDSELMEFDSRYKTLPPLREKANNKELIKLIKQKKVDALCSHHSPQDIEAKKRELDYASFGVINLQTAFAAANTALRNEIPVEDIVYLFTHGPSKVSGLELGTIEEGEKANLSLFNPDKEFTFNKEMVLSKSKNSPFFKRKLKGTVVGIINGKKSHFNG